MMGIGTEDIINELFGSFLIRHHEKVEARMK